MKPNNVRSPLQQTGFSLIEIMVGLVIGLLASMVILQLVSSFEGQKQATTGSADTQTNGTIALFYINRDIQMAGYPLAASTNSPLNCLTLAGPGAPALNTLSPVVITDNYPLGDPGSDAITINYGNSSSGGIPAQILSIPANNTLQLTSNVGINTNNPYEQALIINGTNCTLTPISIVAGSTTLATVANSTNTAKILQPVDVAFLGSWRSVTYSVQNGNLVEQVQSFDQNINQTTSKVVLTGIVNMQAQYGIALQTNAQSVNPIPLNATPQPTSPANNIVNWVDASGPLWATPTVANRNLIKAVRIAVVTRNPKLEPSNVTTPCSTYSAGLCAWDGASFPAPTINLSTSNANWQRYHYHIYDTIIPLRNVLWAWDKL